MDAPLSPRLRILIPLIVALAFLMDQLDSTIIATSVPQMAASLNATPIQLNIAVTAYVLTLAVFIPLSGWLADRFGARRVFITALVIFTIGSGLCGLATSFSMLIAMRVVQGVGRSDDDAGRTPHSDPQFPAVRARHRHDLYDIAGTDGAIARARCSAGS